MVFRPPPTDSESPGSANAEIDYRLTREATLASYRRGDLSRHDACDAHPELRRAGREVGTATAETCPVCGEHDLVHVTYVFGPRLPKHGRCISLRGELARLARRKGVFTAYVIEVCPECAWNHLVRRYTLADDDADAPSDPPTSSKDAAAAIE